jgi:tetratricopeptide (TPR) repeat protein
MTDTEAARNELRIAYKHLLDFEKDDIPECLDSAMRYLQQARKLDPRVTWQHKDEKNKVVTTTPDLLEAIVLHHVTKPTITDRDSSPEKLKAALSLLERSFSLQPISVTYNLLSYAYTRTNQRDKALAILTEGNRRYPEDHTIRAELDFIKSRPDIGLPPRKPVDVFAVSLYSGFGFLAIALFDVYYYLSYPTPTNSFFEFLLIIGKFTWFGAIIAFVAAYLNRPESVREYYSQF